MPVTVDILVAAIISFVFGGGLVTMIRAYNDGKAQQAEAQALGLKTGPEVADLSVATMVKVNEQLTVDYARVTEERDEIYAKFEQLREEVKCLRDALEKTQDDLRAAHAATAALQEQLSTLMDSLPKED